MSTKNSEMQQQVGGDHYKKLAIQPMEYAFKNHLDPLQFSVVKYVTRFRDKAGKQDLDKAKHCVDMLIEMEYGKQAPVGKFNPMSELPNEKEKILLYTKDGDCKLGFRLARGRKECLQTLWYYPEMTKPQKGRNCLIEMIDGHLYVGYWDGKQWFWYDGFPVGKGENGDILYSSSCSIDKTYEVRRWCYVQHLFPEMNENKAHRRVFF